MSKHIEAISNLIKIKQLKIADINKAEIAQYLSVATEAVIDVGAAKLSSNSRYIFVSSRLLNTSI